MTTNISGNCCYSVVSPNVRCSPAMADRRWPGKSEDTLHSRGWSCFDVDEPDETALRNQLLDFARKLGTPVATRSPGSICDALAPTETDDARPRSLSKIHSFGEFPLHIDTAHWLTPCRYVLLACVSPGNSERPTLVLDTKHLSLSEGQVSLLLTTPLRIVNGRNSFFSTILSQKRSFVRLDPGCMMPITTAGAQALEVFAGENWVDRVEILHWKPGRVLVIDNWRVLHGRGLAARKDTDRLLLRISIQ